jgi:hypothetical protein
VYYSLETWQHAARLVLGALLVGGIVAMLVAAKRKRRGDQRASSLTLVGLVSAVVGLIGIMAFQGALDPKRDRAPSPTVNTVAEFRSTGFPAIAVTAPPGWRISFDGDSGRVSLERGHQVNPDDTSWALMSVHSTLMDEPFDLDRMSEALREMFAHAGEIELVRGPERTEFGGMPALLTVKKAAADGILECVWQVKRGRRFVSQVRCTTTMNTDPAVACRDALDRLQWLAPWGVAREALR